MCGGKDRGGIEEELKGYYVEKYNYVFQVQMRVFDGRRRDLYGEGLF